MSDRDVVKSLASQDHHDAYLASREIFRRGSRMIDLLLELEGNDNWYLGGGLPGSITSSTLVLTEPTGDAEFDREYKVSVELAALYLISAIYAGRIDFAQSPYLSDELLPLIEQTTSNDKSLIRRAWKSVRKWRRRTQGEDMDAVRKRADDPLKDGHVGFW